MFHSITPLAMAQTNISGTINAYTNITSVSQANCKSTLTVTNSSPFQVGTKVLIIQCTGGMVDSTNTSNFGKIIQRNGLGNYEFGKIDAIINNDITLSSLLLNSYDMGEKIQLITVPEYTDATITSTLTCDPWNGNTGGILVMEVINNLNFNADIDVTGKGFSGGQASAMNGSQCGENNYSYAAGIPGGAAKGQGFFIGSNNVINGKGALANAGGGGNSHLSGGGGGANYGNGGHGGKEWSGCGNAIANGGIGGYGSLYTNIDNKIFMGGGGGAGHTNGNINSHGGNGGGVVIITAQNINGNSQKIIARGQHANAPTITSPQGMGGGGAGGAILLNVTNYSSLISAESNGGNGGSSNQLGAGPGGGGGGGAIWFSQATTPPNLGVSVLGGFAGTDANGTNYGSTDGRNGVVITQLQVIEPITRFSFGNDTTLCPGDTLILDATQPNATYLWQDGTTDATYTVTHADTYWVAITLNGCTFSDTIAVATLNNLDIGNDTNACIGDTVSINAYLPHAQYQWNTGDTTSQIYVSNPGLYWVVASLATCSETDSIFVNFDPYPVLNLGPDTQLCNASSYLLNAYYPDAKYLWSTGDTSAQLLVDTTGDYWVRSWINNCSSLDSASVNFLTPPRPNLGEDTTICMGESVHLNASHPYSSYVWSNGYTSPRINVSQADTYWVGVTNKCGFGSDTISVTLDDCDCFVYLPNSFTPNGNGDNETFVPAYNCPFYTYEFIIYNPWGQEVFHSTTPGEAWDGFIGAEKASDGVYAYILTYQNRPYIEKVVTGTITLLR